MQKISIWAKHHAFAARIIIFFIHLLLLLLGFYITENIPFHFTFSEIVFILLIIVAASIIYPFVKKNYLFQRILIFFTSGCFFLIVCFFIDHNFNFPNNQKALSAVPVSIPAENKKPSAQEILESLKYRDKSTLTKQEKRILKKEFKKQLVVYGKSVAKNDKASAAKAALIILAIIAALGLVALLGILSCSISCGGSGALAILVFIIGLGGIGIGLYFLLKLIKRKHIKTDSGSVFLKPIPLLVSA
ncbi:MAG: hypothetical protein ABJB05_08590 [Parafilimonas sp.]